MSESPATPEPDVAVEVRKVASLISTARRLLAEGKMVDLSALEGKVKTLCGAICQAPPKDTEGLEASVNDLAEDLDRLTVELTAQFRAITRQIEGAVRRQAMDAYGKAKDES